MGEAERRWDELLPDALGLIFRNLALQEKLMVIPRVCKAWGQVVTGPYCWQEINIDDWSQRCLRPEHLEHMLHLLVARSCGSLLKLSVSGLPNDTIFSFIADHAGSLKTLELPRSEISDSIVEQVASKLASITFLDISYCKKIGSRALQAIGNNCKSLTKLRRTMHPREVEDKVCQDDEAYAIACTMPKLRHLEVGYLILTDQGILEILSQCKNLEYLDMRGCWDVKLDEKFLKEKYIGLKVLGPHVVDNYDKNYWDDEYCSDYSYDDYAWEELMGDGIYEGSDEDDVVWNDMQSIEGLEVRFYSAGHNEAIAGLDWPPSP